MRARARNERNQWVAATVCPLGGSRVQPTDANLPRWVVRHHRLILGMLFVPGLLLNLIRNVRL